MRFERSLGQERGNGIDFGHLCLHILERRQVIWQADIDDFQIATRGHTLPEPTQDAAAIRRAAGQCLKRVPLEKRLRLLGVRVGSLVKRGEWEAAQTRAAQRERELPLF